MLKILVINAPRSKSLSVLGGLRVVGHLLAGLAACAHPHLALVGLGRLEDALLHEALLAERLAGTWKTLESGPEISDFKPKSSGF